MSKERSCYTWYDLMRPDINWRVLWLNFEKKIVWEVYRESENPQNFKNREQSKSLSCKIVWGDRHTLHVFLLFLSNKISTNDLLVYCVLTEIENKKIHKMNENIATFVYLASHNASCGRMQHMYRGTDNTFTRIASFRKSWVTSLAHAN